MTRTYRKIILSAAMLPALAGAQAGKGTAGADWPMYNRDLAGARYLPLTQINTKNVVRLKQVWAYGLRAPEGGASTSEATPIVVNGVMYLPAGRSVLA